MSAANPTPKPKRYRKPSLSPKRYRILNGISGEHGGPREWRTPGVADPGSGGPVPAHPAHAAAPPYYGLRLNRPPHLLNHENARTSSPSSSSPSSSSLSPALRSSPSPPSSSLSSSSSSQSLSSLSSHTAVGRTHTDRQLESVLLSRT